MSGDEAKGARPSEFDGTRPRAAARLGSRVALATALLAVVSLALALTALPNDVPYPFTSEAIAEQWPGDYLWMYPAMLLMLLFVALICLAPVFMRDERTERAIRWLLVLSFAAVIVALAVVSAAHGIDRGDRFEVVVISVVWLTLIAVAPLIAVVFRRALRQPA